MRGCCVHIGCTYVCVFTILNVKINAKVSLCPYLPLSLSHWSCIKRCCSILWHTYCTLLCGLGWENFQWKLIRFSYISQFCITKLQMHQRNNNKSRTCCLTRTKVVALTPSLLCVNAVQRELSHSHLCTSILPSPPKPHFDLQLTLTNGKAARTIATTEWKRERVSSMLSKLIMESDSSVLYFVVNTVK